MPGDSQPLHGLDSTSLSRPLTLENGMELDSFRTVMIDGWELFLLGLSAIKM